MGGSKSKLRAKCHPEIGGSISKKEREEEKGFNTASLVVCGKVGYDHHQIQIEINRSKGGKHSTIKVSSFNVWYQEKVEIYEKMKAIDELIEEHSPHNIYFKDVTPYTHGLFQQSNWWKQYHCSVYNVKEDSSYFSLVLRKVPINFKNRSKLYLTNMKVGVSISKPLVNLATPPPKLVDIKKEECEAQPNEVLPIYILKDSPDVIFVGAMNCDTKLNDMLSANSRPLNSYYRFTTCNK